MDSKEWENFIQQIEFIKTKSNRQVLCAKCWLMLNYEQKIKHIKDHPDHELSILTSTKFASSQQMISLAQACNKLVNKSDGQYILSPFIQIGKSLFEGQEGLQIMSVQNNSMILQSTSTESQNGNYDNSSKDGKDLVQSVQDRMTKIEGTVENIKNTLNIFAQCMQSNHILQQQILHQLEVQNANNQNSCVPSSCENLNVNENQWITQNQIKEEQMQIDLTEKKSDKYLADERQNISQIDKIDNSQANTSNFELSQKLTSINKFQKIWNQKQTKSDSSQVKSYDDLDFNPFKHKYQGQSQPLDEEMTDAQVWQRYSIIEADNFFIQVNEMHVGNKRHYNQMSQDVLQIDED
ncbi:UNKNOWN [Stylonychia lemnae]|uniref:Uncharacterized protein n=1 Tax=Stylonychia lemnae TaxID=5949 RepID=A0A078AYA1_STYLE|nr:UNKNOWN [Stylonychia lemnae]|eukprot:CDW87375.1 UNKNOWN [Stylonychia lemnae]